LNGTDCSYAQSDLGFSILNVNDLNGQLFTLAGERINSSAVVSTQQAVLYQVGSFNDEIQYQIVNPDGGASATGTVEVTVVSPPTASSFAVSGANVCI
jgi:hypothetical protein